MITGLLFHQTARNGIALQPNFGRTNQEQPKDWQETYSFGNFGEKFRMAQHFSAYKKTGSA
jgi:hypothetical protein